MTSRVLRPIRIDGEVAYISLTKGYEALIDVADVPLVEGFNWSAFVKPHAVYARRRARDGGKSINIHLHRAILGAPDGFEVDHRDGDGLNNSRSNLRLATHAQNSCNRRHASRKASTLKGAYFDKRNCRWQAQIKTGGRLMHLGCFDTPEEAHAAYCVAARRFHGEFSNSIS